jgi:hypothetical protein
MSEGESAPRPNVEGLTRLFNPNEVNLDDLAEAIRSLLEPTSPPHIGPHSCQNPDLHSFPRRGTHVLEATETP